MAQEMNHGKAQLLFSRSAEKDFGYPAGYRKLYKWVLLNVPAQVALAVVCLVESSLVMYTSLLSSNPWLFKLLYPDKETNWLWAWHFMEGKSNVCWYLSMLLYCTQVKLLECGLRNRALLG